MSLRRILEMNDLFTLAALSLLLYTGDHSPARPTGTDHVFVGDGQQVPLLIRQLVGSFGDRLHACRHVVVPNQTSRIR